MFPGIGTTLNIITIILGGAIGVFIGSRINQKLRDLILDALGCVTIISAADALMDFWNPAFQSAMPSGIDALNATTIIGNVRRAVRIKAIDAAVRLCGR
ncbi:MAG: DUF554 family protein [Actinobacteria bacterium]|nr:DUF554 family protein [Actinomycetota bacterium]